MNKENIELKAALSTHKELSAAANNQAKTLKLSLEKQRGEQSAMKNLIKELESGTDEKALIGKLYYQVMYSKWSEVL